MLSKAVPAAPAPRVRELAQVLRRFRPAGRPAAVRSGDLRLAAVLRERRRSRFR